MTSVQEGTLITPLGGVLVNQVVDPQRRQEAIAEAAQLPSIRLPAARVADLELLATGAYSPLTGFLSRADYVSVVHRAQLADGTPWTLPITLPVPEGLAH
ncbi:MAG TPA: sulfate adenylyltransferase, partial [Candidatus Dormibacteraeota bacterium]|nr:sulfate adenylyltransferase [Candidatus Dormibacteraeota bacterium]